MTSPSNPPCSPDNLAKIEQFLASEYDVTHHVDDNIFGMRTYYTGQHHLKAIIFVHELRCHPLHSGEVTLIRPDGTNRKTTLRDFRP
jgi:hypothetical protein